MNVLSLFDGISVARQAFHNANIPINKYYCCEIDKYAIQVSKKNWSDNIHLGSVVDFSNISLDIDFLIGGSPCQDLSIAKKGRKGLDGERSGLFWEYVRIKELLKPKYFILENVASMPKKDRDIITEAMGVEPVMFNASLVSAQCRKRLFWTNIKFNLPDDRGIFLKDILQEDAEIDCRFMTKIGKALCLCSSYYKKSVSENQINKCLNGRNENFVKVVGGGLGAKTGLCEIGNIRKLTPIECERLQSLPDNYTSGVSNTQRYKCLGNAFNCEVIHNIIKFI